MGAFAGTTVIVLVVVYVVEDCRQPHLSEWVHFTHGASCTCLFSFFKDRFHSDSWICLTHSFRALFLR